MTTNVDTTMRAIEHQLNLEPLLFFKANHAQFFVSTKQKPKNIDYMYISFLDSYVCLAEKWLEKEKQEWTHGDRIYEPWKAANT